MAARKFNEDALEILKKSPCGFIKDLEKALGKEKVRQLEAIGYIQNAPSEKGYTYQVSRKASQVISDLSTPISFFDHLSDFYYKYVKRVRFSI